jgi:UDP-2,3-diacylglucosamine pyrophosphatase LpxH
MSKQIYIFGDIELGGGTLTDDFISDKTLSAVFSSFARNEGEVDLILNGDTFDFLKCPYVDAEGRRSYPRHITADISVAKLGLTYKAHSSVFLAWKKFLQNSKHSIYFIYGNHDHDLFFPEVQREIVKMVGGKGRVFFQMAYDNHGLHAEHGHQFDFLNKINHRREFINYKGRRILNIPWISFGLISNFMVLKEEHPFLERIKPLPVLFSHHKVVAKKVSWKTVEYFGKSVLYYPLRYCFDPTYVFPKWLFREFYRRLKNTHWDVDDIVHVFKRKKKRSLHKNKLYVLGHIHEKYVEDKEGYVIIHPDTWRDEYIFDTQQNRLIAKEKRYVAVNVKRGKLDWKLVDVPIKRKVLFYDEVERNEHLFLNIVAKEEGYKRVLPLRYIE